VHGLLRFVIGCMSGWSMVLIAAWTNERLGQLGKPGLSAAVFAGPGAGIALSGLLAVYIRRSPCRPGRHGKSTACWRWC
jgi:MFS family permease